MTVTNYRHLIAWQKAMDWVVEIYRLSRFFPKEEVYGLTSQLRRAAISVPSNKAEGHGRFTTREYLRFLSIAHGSLCEAETQLLLSERLGYLCPEESHRLGSLSSEVGRLINGLYTALAKNNDP